MQTDTRTNGRLALDIMIAILIPISHDSLRYEQTGTIQNSVGLRWEHSQVSRVSILRPACYSFKPLSAAHMSQKEADAAILTLLRPLSDDSVRRHSPSLDCKPLQHEDNQCEESTLGKPGEAMMGNRPEAVPKYHMPFRSRSRSHEAPNFITEFNAVHGVNCDRGTLSLDLYRRSRPVKKGRNSEELPHLSTARLRGGAVQRQPGLFGWLRRDQGVDQKLDKDSNKKRRGAITYNGREIGLPPPASDLDVLPPTSIFAKQPGHHPSLNSTHKSPLNNGYNVNGYHLPTLSGQGHTVRGQTTSPLLPLSQIPFSATSRSVTTNPFASIYGNPAIARTCATSPPTDHTAAGSLVDRPSALDGSQTGYDLAPRLPRRNPLHDSDEAPKATGSPHGSSFRSIVQKGRIDRKWDALPALPVEEGAPESSLKHHTIEEDEAKPFDIEEVLR